RSRARRRVERDRPGRRLRGDVAPAGATQPADRGLCGQQHRRGRGCRGGPATEPRDPGRPCLRLLRRHRARLPSLPIPNGHGPARRDVRHDRDPAALGPTQRPGRPTATHRRASSGLHGPQVQWRSGSRTRGDPVIYGGIEAGGTKWVCAIGTGPDDLQQTITFPTTDPEETIAHAADFFSGDGALTAVGIGSFGPIDLRRTSPSWGKITTTPKPGWADTEVVAALSAELDLPVAFDTDVNAAALGEHRWGAAVGLETFCYITVGTGIGGGGMANGHLLHGLLHPELGHMRIPHD